MSNELTRDDLYTLEKYLEIRNDFREKVVAHKKDRIALVGPTVTLHFEDRLIMQYQIQEMLRVEKIFDGESIQEELNAYNPLIPDGSNFKATMMIAYDDPEERAIALQKLLGIENKTFVQIGEFEKVYAIADEDMERQNEQKTSAVHFLRFQLNKEMVSAAKSGEKISVGIDHIEYNYQLNPLPQNISDSLRIDLG